MKENKRIVSVDCQFSISPKLTMDKFEEILLTLLQVYSDKVGLDIISVSLMDKFEPEKTK